MRTVAAFVCILAAFLCIGCGGTGVEAGRKETAELLRQHGAKDDGDGLAILVGIIVFFVMLGLTILVVFRVPEGVTVLRELLSSDGSKETLVMPGRRPLLRHIHHFRAIAILFVVISHVPLIPFTLTGAKDPLYGAWFLFFTNATVFFVLIRPV